MALVNGIDQMVSLLESHNVRFQRFDHPPLFTCEDSVRYGLQFPGADTKNLFLREERGDRYFLVTVSHRKRVDLKALCPILGVKRCTFGSEAELLARLGITPGSVTMLALVNDTPATIAFFVDREVWNTPEIQCHPLVNTSTLVLERGGLEQFLVATGHTPTVIDVPERAAAH